VPAAGLVFLVGLDMKIVGILMRILLVLRAGFPHARTYTLYYLTIHVAAGALARRSTLF
jgi:hypothetical protein